MIAGTLSKRASYDSRVRQAQEAAVFRALGDANRRAILEELRGGERSVAELTRQLGISQPSVSRHLRLLRQAGLVEDEPDGARRLYRLRAEGAEAVRAYIESLWGEAAGRFQLVARNAPKQAKTP